MKNKKLFTQCFFIFIFYLYIFYQNNLIAKDHKLAILNFKDNSSSNDYRNFIKGLPDMLMTNLAESNKIKLVERTQLENALKNYKIEMSGIVNDKTAIKLGKWVGATEIGLGSFANIGRKIRIDVRIISVLNGLTLKTAKVQGEWNKAFDLVDDLASEILSTFTGEKVEFSVTKKILLEKTYHLRMGEDLITEDFKHPYNDSKDFVITIEPRSIEIIPEKGPWKAKILEVQLAIWSKEKGWSERPITITSFPNIRGPHVYHFYQNSFIEEFYNPANLKFTFEILSKNPVYYYIDGRTSPFQMPKPVKKEFFEGITLKIKVERTDI